MGNERSGDDVAGILAILLRASRLAEATPELGWAGKKPVRSGTPKPLRRRKSQRSQVSQGKEAALDGAVQGLLTTGRRLMF